MHRMECRNASEGTGRSAGLHTAHPTTALSDKSSQALKRLSCVTAIAPAGKVCRAVGLTPVDSLEEKRGFKAAPGKEVRNLELAAGCGSPSPIVGKAQPTRP